MCGMERYWRCTWSMNTASAMNCSKITSTHWAAIRVCGLIVMFHVHQKMRQLAVFVCAMCAMERYMKMHMKNEHGDGHWAESWWPICKPGAAQCPPSLQVAPMWAARKLQHEHRRILPCGNTIGHYLAEAFNTRESRFVFTRLLNVTHILLKKAS